MADKNSQPVQIPFKVEFSAFNVGAAPLAHLHVLTEVGTAGHYSVAANIDIISEPANLTQGPGLSTLTAGTEAGAVGELINFIMDRPPVSGFTFGIAATKLHKISATAVSNAGDWPHAITSAETGCSIAYVDGVMLYFYNKSSGGDIGSYDMASTFDDDWGSTVPTGAAALQKNLHPVAVKQDTVVFGNGRYVGTYIKSTTTLAPTKLDFKANTECADVIFNANQWWLAINSGTTTSTDRVSAQIYLWDGGAISSLLSDEVAVGIMKIGWIMAVGGVVYAAYQDLSSAGGFCIGYVSGRALKPLRHFTGSLPTFAQKTLYINTILTLSSGLVYSCGAVTDSLPIQLSQLADGGFSTVGAIAAPFGTPMIASSQSTSFKLAQFSGYDVAASWKSIVIQTMNDDMVGVIDKIIVVTNTLGSGASCALTIESNQAATTSPAMTITTTGKRRHVFRKIISDIEDFRVALSWAAGSTSNPVKIRKIIVKGHFKEKA